MLNILTIFLFQFVTNAEPIKLVTSGTAEGIIETNDLRNIISCTLKIDKSKLRVLKVPPKRGKQLFDSNSVDMLFPSLKTRDSKGLFPLYIDEYLLISNKEMKDIKFQDFGSLRGDYNPWIVKKYDLREVFTVGSVSALIKGLQDNRVSSILMKRSQIPKSFNIIEKNLYTLGYEETGVLLNDILLKKVSMKYKDIKRRYRSCLLGYDINISNIKKKIILDKSISDFKKIQSQLALKKRIVKDIAKKEEAWTSVGDRNLIESYLDKVLIGKLKKAIKDINYINEAFIFNHEGALLATIHETSDFDQSDEEKFRVVRDFKNYGIQNISNIYFDESTRTFQFGVSLRLIDKNGQFVGGVYLGIDTNKFFTHYKI